MKLSHCYNSDVDYFPITACHGSVLFLLYDNDIDNFTFAPKHKTRHCIAEEIFVIVIS